MFLTSLKLIAFGFLLGCLAGCGLESGPLRGLMSGTVGVKNFAQAKIHFDDATEVQPDGDINNTQALANILLPGASDVHNLSPEGFLGFLGLAGAYCEQMIDTDLALPDTGGIRRALDGVIKASGVAGLNPAIRTKVLRRYTELFWRRQPTSEEEASLMEALSEAEQGGSLKQVLLVGCTIVAGGVDSLRF